MKKQQVWKYTLLPRENILSIPVDAKILHVGEQAGNVCMWVLVNPDPDLECEDRSFAVFGTGHDIVDMDIDHIGTVSLNGGSLIFHVFEL